MDTQETILRESIIIGVMRNHFFDQFLNPYDSRQVGCLDGIDDPLDGEEIRVYEKIQDLAGRTEMDHKGALEDLGISLAGKYQEDPDGFQKTAHLLKSMVDTLAKDLGDANPGDDFEFHLTLRGLEYALQPGCIDRYASNSGLTYTQPASTDLLNRLRDEVYNAYHESDHERAQKMMGSLSLVYADHLDGGRLSTFSSLDDLLSECDTLNFSFESAYYHPLMEDRRASLKDPLCNEDTKPNTLSPT